MLRRMSEASVVEWIREKNAASVSDLDERGRRRWAAAESRSSGWGGITAVALAMGISDRTIRTGIKELDDPQAAASNRQRKPGARRRTREVEQPGLAEALEELVESGTRGDPVSPLRWTCKSTRTVADERWQEMGRQRYPKTKRLLVTAGGDGSNSPRTRLWRGVLQQSAYATWLTIELCHHSPGTSKSNKIEYRLFCHITKNWQGVPLETHVIAVQLIGATKTDKGLEVPLGWLKCHS